MNNIENAEQKLFESLMYIAVAKNKGELKGMTHTAFNKIAAVISQVFRSKENTAKLQQLRKAYAGNQDALFELEKNLTSQSNIELTITETKQVEPGKSHVTLTNEDFENALKKSPEIPKTADADNKTKITIIDGAGGSSVKTNIIPEPDPVPTVIRQLNDMEENQILAHFGGLSKVKKFAADNMQLEFKRNDRKDKVLPAFKERLKEIVEGETV